MTQYVLISLVFVLPKFFGVLIKHYCPRQAILRLKKKKSSSLKKKKKKAKNIGINQVRDLDKCYITIPAVSTMICV